VPIERACGRPALEAGEEVETAAQRAWAATVMRGMAVRQRAAASDRAGGRRSRPRVEVETVALDCCGPGDTAEGGGEGGAEDLGGDGVEAAAGTEIKKRPSVGEGRGEERLGHI
jgi:hypothetical protein